MNAKYLNLADVLKRIFADPRFFGSHEKWAEFLMTASVYTNLYQVGRTVPPARELRMIRDHLKDCLSPDDELSADLETVLKIRTIEAAPYAQLSVLQYRTLEDYLVTPLITSFEEALYLLPIPEREKILTECATLVFNKAREVK